MEQFSKIVAVFKNGDPSIKTQGDPSVLFSLAHTALMKVSIELVLNGYASKDTMLKLLEETYKGLMETVEEET